MEDKLNNVDTQSNLIADICDNVLYNFCKELDDLMDNWRSMLKDKNNPPTDLELEDIIAEIPVILYFFSEGVEKVGIKEDIANALRQEVYNKINIEEHGNVGDRKSMAELGSQEEEIVKIAYKRAAKILKYKLEAGYELLNSAKKILGFRQAKLELHKLDRGRNLS